MQPRMSAKEIDLFVAFVKNSKNSVEFGTGGSTFVASHWVKNSIISLDSSRDWLDNVLRECEKNVTIPNRAYW
jgi:hypothetical protein